MAKNGRIMGARGQTALEVAMVIPLFMLFAFLALQFGHLGIGVAIVNYAASSIARQAVAQNGYNQGDADTRFKKILFAGLESTELRGSVVADGEGTNNVIVTACADLPSFPLVAPFLNKVFTSAAPPTSDGCRGATKWMGPIGIKGSRFLIQGQAVARMNYNAGK